MRAFVNAQRNIHHFFTRRPGLQFRRQYTLNIGCAIESSAQVIKRMERMALFGLFGRKRKGYASSWLQLTVVYATALEGLDPEQAFSLRGRVLAAKPIDFEFQNADSFLVFYPGTAAGLLAGNDLAEALKQVARDKAIPAFGVAVQQGECLAQMNGAGRFVAKPMGGLIFEAKNLAIHAAKIGAQ